MHGKGKLKKEVNIMLEVKGRKEDGDWISRGKRRKVERCNMTR